MNTWKIIFATLVIFGAGVVTGRLFVATSSHPHVPVPVGPTVEAPRNSGASPGAPRENRLPPPMPVPLRKDFIDRLDRELKLSTHQRECIEKVICDGQDQTRAIWKKVEPEMHKTLVETKERIRGELSPRQQTQFGELLKQRNRAQPRPATNMPPVGMTNSAALDLDLAFCQLMKCKPGCSGTNSVTARCL